MRPVFVDTSFYVALISPADQFYEPARQWMAQGFPKLVVTELIFVELANFFSKGPGRRIVRDLVGEIRSDPSTEVVAFSSELLDRALGLYDQRPDKEWSLTDCISFVVMNEKGITEALSADHHFEQAGFRTLLLSGPDLGR